MKLGLIGGAAMIAALLTPFAITVVGATAPAPKLAELQIPVGPVQAMNSIEQSRAATDASAPTAASAFGQEESRAEPCSRPVRVVGTSYGEPVLCRK